MNRTAVGRAGEEAAERYLSRKGYEIVFRNFRTRYGEIDLICRDKETTVFAEVKAKRGESFGRPEEMFTRGKYEKVRRMAQVFLKGREANCRIDMVAVELDSTGQAVSIRHYENAGGDFSG